MSLNPSYKYYLGLDISLSSPGFAVIRVENRQAEIVFTFNVKTKPGRMRGFRYEVIEEELYTNLCLLGFKQFDGIIRETFHSRIPDTNAGVFGAWASVDRALARFGMEVTAQYSASQVKKAVTGKGKAEKPEVAAAVCKWLSLPADYQFKTNDESDACAIVLAHLIKEGLIDAKA
jgi:crossover junction endodeoxyribonuclease RuvC